MDIHIANTSRHYDVLYQAKLLDFSSNCLKIRTIPEHNQFCMRLNMMNFFKDIHKKLMILLLIITSHMAIYRCINVKSQPFFRPHMLHIAAA